MCRPPWQAPTALPAKERAAIREEAAARVQQLRYNIAMNLPFPSQVLLPPRAWAGASCRA